MKGDFYESFDEKTLTKLDIYKSYVTAWLPVFLSDKWDSKSKIFFFDFFSGPGEDDQENKGSPLILLEQLKEQLDTIRQKQKTIHITFNDKDKNHVEVLREVCQSYGLPESLIKIKFYNMEFSDAFERTKPDLTSRYPKLVFLDQFGIKHVDPEMFRFFKEKCTFTDILVFVASSAAHRFKQAFPQYNIPKNTRRDQAHRVLSDQYRRGSPSEYYVGDYSIKSGANIYGLVFGSHHWLGIYKFLEIAWKSGRDANFDIEKRKRQLDFLDPSSGETRLSTLKREVIEKIKSRDLSTDGEVALYCMMRGVFPKMVTKDLYKKLKEQRVLTYNRGEGTLPRQGKASIKEPRQLILVNINGK